MNIKGLHRAFKKMDEILMEAAEVKTCPEHNNYCKMKCTCEISLITSTRVN